MKTDHIGKRLEILRNDWNLSGHQLADIFSLFLDQETADTYDGIRKKTIDSSVICRYESAERLKEEVLQMYAAVFFCPLDWIISGSGSRFDRYRDQGNRLRSDLIPEIDQPAAAAPDPADPETSATEYFLNLLFQKNESYDPRTPSEPHKKTAQLLDEYPDDVYESLITELLETAPNGLIYEKMRWTQQRIKDRSSAFADLRNAAVSDDTADAIDEIRTRAFYDGVFQVIQLIQDAEKETGADILPALARVLERDLKEKHDRRIREENQIQTEYETAYRDGVKNGKIIPAAAAAAPDPDPAQLKPLTAAM